MIEAQHTVLIEAPIEAVWGYVQDMRRWANFLPGCQECIPIDADNSRWILKVGTAGLLRTVNVRVHVDEWDAPRRVNFSYLLEGDPVEGSGSYFASASSPRETEVTLKVRVQGSGPLAPMWTALSRPLLPRLAKDFAMALKAEIEKSFARDVANETVARDPLSILKAFGKKIRCLWTRSQFHERAE